MTTDQTYERMRKLVDDAASSAFVNEHAALSGGNPSHPVYEKVYCTCGNNLTFDITRDPLTCSCGALLTWSR